MEQYLNELDKIESTVTNRLKNAPNGFLEITGTKKRHNYYWYNSYTREGNKPVYLKKDEQPLIQALIQKSYDKMLLKKVINDKEAIKKCLETMKGNLDSVYTDLSEIRKPYVKPYRMDDDTFLKKWEGKENKGNPSYPVKVKHTTLRNEIVRSKSERSIADTLFRCGIPYKYEMPLHLDGVGVVHPDFTILDIRSRKIVYWEHMGCMEDLDYVKTSVVNKIAHYAENGIIVGKNLIITMETNDCPLDQPMIYQMIDTFLR